MQMAYLIMYEFLRSHFRKATFPETDMHIHRAQSDRIIIETLYEILKCAVETFNFFSKNKRCNAPAFFAIFHSFLFVLLSHSISSDFMVICCAVEKNEVGKKVNRLSLLNK